MLIFPQIDHCQRVIAGFYRLCLPSIKALLAALTANCSTLLVKPMQESMGFWVLIPTASATDVPKMPAETFSKFQVSFYTNPVDAVYKTLGFS
ncbi:hypothetical protein EDB62_10364 [Vibrio crassostreae]|nr:hypothetical protein EDB62_10364 [Vibrio crassostreae]